MSVIIEDQSTAGTATPEAPSSSPRRLGIWVRVGLALALIAGSAGLRFWQQSRFDDIVRTGQVSPFPLEEIPLQLGPWSGIDDELDPRIASATGAVDGIFRTYTNQMTGARVSLILLYGPAAEVKTHTPENCYPTSGYEVVSGPDTRKVDLGDHQVPFYAHTFARGEGGQRETQRVFCTWRYGKTWVPNQLAYKEYERIPGMYKVHLARAALPGERFGDRDPCEDLANLLLPVMEQRLEASGTVPG